MTEQKQEYAIVKSNTVIQNYHDVEMVARAMSGSGFFQDSRQASQAIVKVLAGHELGFGPFASMTGIHIIQGKPAFGANLIAGAIKAKGKYDYRINALDDTHCEVEFYQIADGKSVSLGKSSFSIEDAKKAGLTNKDNWSKFPRNMLFSRAISNGARWYTPDVFSGAPVYTPEELGAEVDQDGNVIEGSFTEPTSDTPETKEPVSFIMSYEDACKVTGSDKKRYGNCTDKELKGKRIGILKALKGDVDAIKQSQYQNKLEAIKVLLSVPEGERLKIAGQPELTDEQAMNDLGFSA